MSIRSSIFYVRIWCWPDVWLHVFSSMHDQRIYATIDTDMTETQVWPPARNINRRTGAVSPWHYQRFMYHDYRPSCTCWRCVIAEKDLHE